MKWLVGICIFGFFIIETNNFQGFFATKRSMSFFPKLRLSCIETGKPKSAKIVDTAPACGGIADSSCTVKIIPICGLPKKAYSLPFTTFHSTDCKISPICFAKSIDSLSSANQLSIISPLGWDFKNLIIRAVCSSVKWRGFIFSWSSNKDWPAIADRSFSSALIRLFAQYAPYPNINDKSNRATAPVSKNVFHTSYDMEEIEEIMSRVQDITLIVCSIIALILAVVLPISIIKDYKSQERKYRKK